MDEKKQKYAPQERWQKKAGLKTKAFKLKVDLTDQFAEACDKVGISQAKQISIMMEEFIEKVNKND